VTDLFCAEQSEALGEPLAGSAAHAHEWLFLEEPGPWAPKTLDTPGIAGMREPLEEWLAGGDRRLQLIKRKGGAGRQVFLADTLHGVVRQGTLEGDALQLDDLSPDGATRAFVCTHGKRDRCCAKRGRALFTALEAAGVDVWQTTHLGGHRFAATMVMLPSAYCLGHVPPEEAPAIAEAMAARVLPALERVRGHVSLPPAMQAAEIAARRQLDHHDLERPSLDTLDEGHVAVSFGGRTVRVEVAPVRLAGERPKSCGDALTPIDAVLAKVAG